MENSYTPLVANSTAGSVDNDNDVADGAIAEKPLSRKMSCDSIEKLDTIDDFSSFKCYSSKEIANRVVMFNQIGLAYSLDRPVTAYFYASKETYEMLPDDTVGICPLQKKAIIKKQLSDCEEFGFDQDDGLASKKVVFDLRGVEDLPVDSRHYYQFVYENALGDILGISMPFQFNQELNDMPQQRSPSPSTSENTNGELNNKVTDEDFVMVHQPDVFLKDRYEHLSKANKLLDYIIRNMESELSDKSKEIALLRAEGEKACQAIEAVQDENVSLKEKCHTFEKYIESYANELAKKNDELHQANENISKLQENFSKVIEEQKREIEDKGRIDLNLTEMRKILVDKEEEITRFKNLNAEYIVKNESLEKRLGLARTQIESVQSNLVGVLNERNRLSTQVTDSEQDKKKIAELANTVSELEAKRDELNKGMRSLVSKLDHLNTKYHSEHESSQRAMLANDRMKAEMAEMRARLSSAREEYAKLYKAHQSVVKANQKPTTVSRSVDARVPFSTIFEEKSQPIATAAAAISNKDVEAELLNLQKSMNLDSSSPKKTEQSITDNNNSSSSTEGRLIEIEEEPTASAPSNEITHPKELINDGASTSAASAPAAGADKTKKAVTIPCVMCDQMITCEVYADDTPRQMYEMVTHLEEVHMQRMCPVCSTMFDTRLPIFSTYFNSHVQGHFNNDVRYPPVN